MENIPPTLSIMSQQMLGHAVLLVNAQKGRIFYMFNYLPLCGIAHL